MKRIALLTAAVAALSFAGAAQAGNVFLTGHDPDFHAQGQASGADELTAALNFVTSGTFNDGTTKFLWVESFNAPTSGHRVGFDGLSFVGVGAGNVDWVDGAGFASVDLSGYSAIVVASSFGGMLTDAELSALNARAGDIKTFINSGRGLAAFAECGPSFSSCDAASISGTVPLFGFVPVSATAVVTLPPYNVTPYGMSIGFSNADANDCCTHNSFADAAGLNIVDSDANGVPTTLAGNVRIGDGGFQGIPEPSAWALMILGFGAAGAMLRRRRIVAA